MEEKPPSLVQLEADLKRLKQDGWWDLYRRPERYSVLARLSAQGVVGDLPDEGPGRASARVHRFLTGVLDRIPDRKVADAWSALLGLSRKSAVALDERRRAAGRAYTGGDRQPNTVYKVYEPEITPFLIEALGGSSAASSGGDAARPPPADQDLYETIANAEDALEAAAQHINEQQLQAAGSPLRKVLSVPLRLDASEREIRLYARAYYLRGHVYRDEGRLAGDRPAEDSYRRAAALYRELGDRRPQARAELMQAVLSEMSGRLPEALERYLALADDPRLPELDRYRARLWAGSTLTKLGQGEEAHRLIVSSLRYFEHENSDVISGRLKLAANLRAFRAPDLALDTLAEVRTDEVRSRPLLVVRLDVAAAHALLSDPEAIDDGLALLQDAQVRAERHMYGHQLGRIKALLALATAPSKGPTQRSRIGSWRAWSD